MVPAFDPGNRLIAALDVPDRGDAVALVDRLGGEPSFVKIGLELFCAGGPDVVKDVRRRHRVMLDLKLHDIPETVGRATGRIASLGAELLTVHASGGRKMLEHAVRAAGSTRILAVTVLTSLDEQDLTDIYGGGTIRNLVVRWAKLAADAGCAGVVTSAQEATAVREAVPSDFLIVTPGIRPAGTDAADQKRVMTPKRARELGADLIVVGRPLRDASDPAAAARAIITELR